MSPPQAAPLGTGEGRKPRSGLEGCLIGCAIVLAGVAAVCIPLAILGWMWVTSDRQIARGRSVFTGGESAYLSAFVSADDPGLVALAEHTVRVLQDVQQSGQRGNPGPAFAPGGSAGWYLPVRIELRAWPTDESAQTPFLFELQFSKNYRLLQLPYRAILWATRGSRGPDPDRRVGDAEIHALPGEDGDDAATAFVENRLLFGSRRADVEAVLRRSPDEDVRSLPVTLARPRAASRLPQEDLWGFWTLPPELAQVGAERMLLSADIVSADRMAWKAAFVASHARGREGEVETRIAGALDALATGAGLHLEQTALAVWLDRDTLVLQGTLTGMQAALEGSIRGRLQTGAIRTPPTAAPR